MMETPETCPNCGAEVPEGSLSCPGCGSDHNTGWNTESTKYDGVNLPEPDFDYEKCIKNDDMIKEKYQPKSAVDSFIEWLKSIFF
jgi:hypothetical protein